jgi:transcriptional regulator with XRE-family HTH domain
MTQCELAKASGISATNISRYETGARRLSVENAKTLASALNTDWMCFFEDNANEDKGANANE